MTEDNWSLKGKSYTPEYCEDENSVVMILEDSKRISWIHVKEIETLRKKLIEDIEKVTSDEGMTIIERIINRRFGK